VVDQCKDFEKTIDKGENDTQVKYTYPQIFSIHGDDFCMVPADVLPPAPDP
jgi:hypothetical protein